jgi:hypothetical protein
VREETNMKRVYLFLLVLIALPLVMPARSEAIPAFARKHGFNCMMCHTAYPKLNDWGQRFRDNGYQVPGQQGREKNVFETPPPLALRTSTGLNGFHRPGQSTEGFDLMGLDLLAAGVLVKNVGMFLVYTPRIDEPAADFAGSGPSQPGALESANVIFSNICSGAFNFRVGRFEPAYHLFSSKRSYYLLEPYEVYEFDSPANDFVFNDNQTGVELTGHFRSGFKYGAGVVNGTGTTPDNNTAKDYYGVISQGFGAGDGESAGQRISAFGYFGEEPIALQPAAAASPTGEGASKSNHPIYRYGGSASLNWKTFNLELFFLMGVDDKHFGTPDLNKSYKFNGGFAELDYAGLMNNRLVASALFNFINPPDTDKDRKLNAYSGLLRCYMGDWTAVNIALHAEYTYRRTGDTNVLKEHLYSLLVDFAF